MKNVVIDIGNNCVFLCPLFLTDTALIQILCIKLIKMCKNTVENLIEMCKYIITKPIEMCKEVV